MPVAVGGATPPPTLTVAVLTLNEAHRIEACLQSAAFADQLLVVDSGSTDDTVAIAQRLGAEVHNYPDWKGFAVQRNRLLAHARGDYIFFLDADEVMTPAFAQELQAIVRSGAQAVWSIRWRMVAYGHELRYFRSQSQIERLFVRAMVREFTGVVHEQAELLPLPGGGAVPRRLIEARLLHYSRTTVRGSLESSPSTPCSVPPSGRRQARRAAWCGAWPRAPACSCACMCFGWVFCVAGRVFCIVCLWHWRRSSGTPLWSTTTSN